MYNCLLWAPPAVALLGSPPKAQCIQPTAASSSTERALNIPPDALLRSPSISCAPDQGRHYRRTRSSYHDRDPGPRPTRVHYVHQRKSACTHRSPHVHLLQHCCSPALGSCLYNFNRALSSALTERSALSARSPLPAESCRSCCLRALAHIH
jgi:hypothetical protein